MNTLKADKYKRIRFPDIKPLTVYACENGGNGTITLTEVKAESKERFPRGSLLKYFTPDRDKDEALIFQGTVKGPK